MPIIPSNSLPLSFFFIFINSIIMDVSVRIAATSISLAATKMILDGTGAAITPFTGYQYTKAAGEHLDSALEIINGPQGKNLDDEILAACLESGDQSVFFGPLNFVVLIK
jgi:hypothetical protein